MLDKLEDIAGGLSGVRGVLKRESKHLLNERHAELAEASRVLLIYFEPCPDPTQAIAREKQLKGWTRAKKEALITTFNPTWTTIDPATWSDDS